MNVRESINAHRGKVIVVVAIALLLLILFLLWPMNSEDTMVSAKAFFTIDDGRTWFKEDSEKLSPFSYNGKVAYRCYVYTCDEGKTMFVSHLERYSDDAKKVMQTLQDGKSKHTPTNDQTLLDGVEVKRPDTGDKGWIKMRDPRSLEITTPRCPEDPRRGAIPVEP